MFEFDEEWLAKVEALRASGREPYPSAAGMAPTHTTRQIREAFDGRDTQEALDAWTQAEGGRVSVAGRVMFRNVMGKAMFLRIQDRDGLLQIYARREGVGEDTFARLKAFDIGDFVWAAGGLMRTKTGEPTLLAAEARPAAKILRPFPDRFHGVSDVEQRSRQRYVDLFINPDSRETFRKRSEIVRYLRDFFHGRDFLEVETPMMQVIPGGATARPFVTHHNALDMPLYLRVAPELYLKRLVVGGLERVFEINRNFRNEGVSPRHNPEFTMLEFYQAWATFEDLIRISEDLLSGLAKHLHGGYAVPFRDWTLNFEPPFRRADMDALIAEKTAPLGLAHADLRDPAKILDFWLAQHPEDGRPSLRAALPTTFGRWWEKLFEAYVEPTLIDPTFVTGFPAEISPLARRSDGDPERTDRFELYCATWEIANAFTELNDPVDQAQRFEAQARAKAGGDEEAMYFDADYVRALTYGMPPTAGQGIGVDRLVMLMTGRTSIREVILFPTLRPEADKPAEAQPPEAAAPAASAAGPGSAERPDPR